MKDNRMRLIEDFVEEYARKNNGPSPSVREIEAGTGIPRSTVSRYLIAMDREGLLKHSGTRNITTPQMCSRAGTTVPVPLVGSIACGLPGFAEENIEEYIDLPVSFLGRGTFFLLRAKGDSMVGIGIDDGDLVLVRQQSTAAYNEVVVALVGDETTLKRFRPQSGCIVLHPENPAYKDIEVEDCAVQGVALKVIKDIR